ncbi:MAG: hypothetical protein ACK5MA_04410 [Parachlamydiaceae bacterium]
MQSVEQAVRTNPVKDFFHNPKVKGTLKITAVALAAIAIVADLLALSLFFPPTAPLVVIAFIGGCIALAVTVDHVKDAVKKAKIAAQPEPAYQESSSESESEEASSSESIPAQPQPIPQQALAAPQPATQVPNPLREANKVHMIDVVENYAGGIDRLGDSPLDKALSAHGLFLDALSRAMKKIWSAGIEENTTNVQLLEFAGQLDRFNEAKERVLTNKGLEEIRPQLEEQFTQFLNS